MSDLLTRAAKALSFPMGASTLELAAPWALVLLALPLLVYLALPAYKERQPALRVPFFERLAAGLDRKPEPGAVVLRKLVLQWLLAPLVFVLLVAAAARPELVLAADPEDGVRARPAAGRGHLDLDEHAGLRRSAGPEDRAARRGRSSCSTTSSRGGRATASACSSSARRPHLQVPFTLDHDLCRELLREVQVGMAGPRTMIGDAIGLAIKLFEESPAQQKVVVLLTDGNDTGSRVPPTKAAEIARSHGITIHTVGIGDPATKGADIVDAGTLAAIARDTGGASVHGARPRRARGHLPKARRDREGRAEDGELPTPATALPVAARSGHGAPDRLFYLVMTGARALREARA